MPNLIMLPFSSSSSQPLEMHEVIAECMIFANHWVAKKIHEAYPTQALLRHHPPPSLDRWVQTCACVCCVGLVSF